MPPPRSTGPIFIVGSDRSGTTLLRLYLNASPGLAIPNESWFLIPLLEAFPHDRALTRSEAVRAVGLVADHKRFHQGWNADPEALTDEIAARAPLPLAELIDALFRREIAPTGKPRWGDKTPEYLFHVDTLARLFPEARFVQLVRDGRDVCLSLFRARFKDRGWTPYRVGAYWRRCIAAGARHTATLGPDRFRTIYYEDLVTDTRGQLERLCAFLDLPFDPAMLDPHDDAEEMITEAEKRMGIHTKLTRRPRPSDVERWRREDSLMLTLANGFLRDGLTRHGYPEPPGPVRAPLQRAGALGLEFLHRSRIRAWRLRRRLRGRFAERRGN